MAVPSPCYIRVSRDVVPVLTDSLAAGKSFGGVQLIYDEGADFAIVYEGTALMAAKQGFDRLHAKA